LDSDVRFAIFAKHFEGEMLYVGLHLGVSEFATDETLGVENTVTDRSTKKLTYADE
jgi:hypothetical protein